MTKARTVILTLSACAVIGALGGIATVGLGLYNISAQAGHWPGVGPLMHTAFRQSIKLRSPSMDTAPDLSDPELIALGAGHYATACTACHAAPGQRRPATALAMSPQPPHIEEAVQDWQANHMQWIVENGAKMTGMPGWPAMDRGDEAWAVAAYLSAIQQGNAPDLPEADLPLGRDNADLAGVKAYCQTCHGPVGGTVPRLDIQTPDYLLAQLEAYRGTGRPSGVMEQAVSLYPPAMDTELAAFLAAEPTERNATGGSAEGEALATEGTRDVPACVACHGPGRSRDARAGQPRFPSLAGQNRAFIAAQLKLWRDEVIHGSDLMTTAARDLTDTQIEALAAWFASLPDEEDG